MGTANTELGKSYLATFMKRLEQLGWANGRNARIETRWWTGTLDEMRPVVAELLAFSPDVIMAFSNPAVALLKPTAGEIPIVFVGVGDPIGDGFVPSLAHPGGNITGFAGTDGPIGGKWLEVLKETAPHVTQRPKKGCCRLHGGASGSGGPPGERNGQSRHGERTKATFAEQRKFSALLKMLRAGLT